MASISRLSTAAQFFEEDGGGSEAISTYDRVSLNFLMKVTSDLDPDPCDLDLESAFRSIWIFKMKIFGVVAEGGGSPYVEIVQVEQVMFRQAKSTCQSSVH